MLRPLLVVVLALALSGCIKILCDDTEDSSQDACERIVDAFACAGYLSVGSSTLCSSQCQLECHPRTEVDACVAAIEAVGCDQLSEDEVRALVACGPLLADIASEPDCSASAGDDDDDD